MINEDWKTIDTAPKDGTMILGCYFSRDGRFYEINAVSYRGYTKFQQGKKEWRDRNGYRHTLTHWMELPEPPKI